MAKSWKKHTLPKRIAGVKVPKPLRKRVGKFAMSQDGRKLITEAVAAGVALSAARALGTEKGRRRTRRVTERSADAVQDKAGAVMSEGAALAPALREAIAAFTSTLQREKAQADARAAWPEGERAEPEPRGRRAGEALTPH